MLGVLVLASFILILTGAAVILVLLLIAIVASGLV